MERTENFHMKLENLPDDCLFYIIDLLDASSRYFLSLTCKRFRNLIESPRFWRIIDIRPSPHCLEKFNYCIDKITENTSEFYINYDSDKSILTNNFFARISCTNLRIIAIENQTINCHTTSDLTIKDFPRGLEELSLKRTKFKRPMNFFTQSHEHMTQLRVLILDECHWVSSSMFMSLAKYKNLEILSVYKCCGIDDSIAYLSVSGLGYRRLKIFDGRLTRLGNTLLGMLSSSKAILAIYLQNQNVSYKLDYYKRQLELLQNGKEISDLDINKEFGLDNQFLDEFGNDEEYPSLTDNGLFAYKDCETINDRFELPKSVLYKDPYNECNCGYNKTKAVDQNNRPYDSDDDDDDGDNNDQYKSLLNKIKKLTNLLKSNQINLLRPLSAAICSHSYPRRINYDVYDPRRVKVITISFHDRPSYREDHHNLEDDDDNNAPPWKRQRTEQSNDRNDNNQENPGPSRRYYNQLPNEYPLVRIVDFYENREKKSTSIKRLSLRGYSTITNVSLTCLKDLNLELLDLTYTKITQKAIDEFLLGNPNCRIIHEAYCRCLINLHF